MTQAIRTLLCGLVTLAALLLGAAPAGAQQSAAKHLRMRLAIEGGAPRVGQPLVLALDTRPEPGWHGYWTNPGDAGLPAAFDWVLPPRTQVGVWQWPVPTTLIVAGLMNFVYEAPYAPIVTLKLPPVQAGQRLPIRLHARYLVCTASLCVPEEQTLAIDPVVENATAPRADAAFDAYRSRLPRPLGGQALYQSDSSGFRIAIPYPATATLRDAYFFPRTSGALDYAAPQQVVRDGDRLVLTTRPAAGASPPGAIEGVLRIGPGQGLRLRAVPGVVPAARQAGDWWAVLAAFAGAVLGGLILNVMPCVFPILSLKALSLARGGVGAREARLEALAYTAGVVLVCVALGAVILALRAAGSSVGWAFQLQDVRVVVALLALCVAITLNLWGWFEFATPRFAGHGGAGGAFATGALAAFVATPCSGPFMATALGAALVLPWPAALAVFGGLGLGLALPFLAIGFVPALRRRLPRPGPWMGRLRRVLAVPMALTAVALGWLLWRQAGGFGLALALVVTLATALLLAWGGRRQKGGKGFGRAAMAGIALVIAGGVAAAQGGPTRVRGASADEPFSEARLASLRAQGRPVFAYFTADWCLTCKVNEQAAIDTASTRAALARHKVAVLVGDWTNGDPALGRFIEAHNRAGVPLYLFYPAGGGEPEVLPQVLTPGLLQRLGEKPS